MILTAGVSVLAFFIFKPYIGPIFLAAIIAIASHPFYKNLLKIFKGKNLVASFAAVFIIIAVILVPAFFIGLALFKEATVFYNHISSGQAGSEGFLSAITSFFESKINFLAPEFSIDLGEYLKNLANWITGNLDSFFSNFFKILIGLLLMIISLFYFLKDGERIVKRLVAFSPLADSYDEQIMKRVGLAINSIVRGSLIIALTKGFLTALGFAIFGIPNPILWGVVSALASFIPVVGSSIVIVPAILYLFVTKLLRRRHQFCRLGNRSYRIIRQLIVSNFNEKRHAYSPVYYLAFHFWRIGAFRPHRFHSRTGCVKLALCSF